jgi:hypothetical protein
MISWIGLAVMVVGAIVVFIDPAFKNLWKKDPPKVEIAKHAPDDKQLRDILDKISVLESACDRSPTIIAIEQLSKKIEYLEVKIQNQRPPKVDVHFPDHVGVSMVTPVEIKGTTAIVTPRPIKVLHRQVQKPSKKVMLDKVKKQIEGLSK